jgi:hypothetical protein
MPAPSSCEELSPGPTGMPTSVVGVRAELRTSHEEPAPRDEQLEAVTTSTTRVGTHTHQVRLTVKTTDTPRKASGKGKPTLQSPSCSDPLGPSQWGSGSTSMAQCPLFLRGREHSRTSVGSMPCSSTKLSGRLPLKDTMRTLSGARRVEHQKCTPLAHPPHVQGRPPPKLSNPLTYTA